MFTGIIEDLGVVKFLKKGMRRISVASPIFDGQKIDDSIAVNGVCLTISDLRNGLASFDIMEETVHKSNLGVLSTGDRVNLERPLEVGGRINGHLVTGHVDCTGKIIKTNKEAGSHRLDIKVPKDQMRLVVSKGSIALDGISLTIAEVKTDNFVVYLIPHTLHSTNIQFKKEGDEVNIEFDLIGKYIVSLMEKGPPRPTMTEAFLREHGF